MLLRFFTADGAGDGTHLPTVLGHGPAHLAGLQQYRPMRVLGDIADDDVEAAEDDDHADVNQDQLPYLALRQKPEDPAGDAHAAEEEDGKHRQHLLY